MRYMFIWLYMYILCNSIVYPCDHSKLNIEVELNFADLVALANDLDINLYLYSYPIGG